MENFGFVHMYSIFSYLLTVIFCVLMCYLICKRSGISKLFCLFGFLGMAGIFILIVIRYVVMIPKNVNNGNPRSGGEIYCGNTYGGQTSANNARSNTVYSTNPNDPFADLIEPSTVGNNSKPNYSNSNQPTYSSVINSNMNGNTVPEYGSRELSASGFETAENGGHKYCRYCGAMLISNSNSCFQCGKAN